MKNISRRVFIKGLAVAGAAAAASTVLAGCNTNMIPGVGDDTDEPEVEAPADSKVMTFVSPLDDEKTLTITFGSLVQPNNDWNDTDEGKAKIKVVIDNKMGAAATFNPSTVTANSLYFSVKAYANGNSGVNVLATDASTLGASPASIGQNSTSNTVNLANLDTYNATKVTVEVTMYQALDGTDTTAKHEIKKQSITYTL